MGSCLTICQMSQPCPPSRWIGLNVGLGCGGADKNVLRSVWREKYVQGHYGLG